MKSLALSLILLLISPAIAGATEYFIKHSGGGTGYDATQNPTGQCNGTSSASYDGSGTNEACAWNNYFWAVSWKDGAYPAKVTNGDIITVLDNGEIGYGANGNSFASTSSSFPWDAYPKALPDGVTLRGVNYANCNSRTDTVELAGRERTGRVLNLQGTDNGTIQCLTITDHEQCGEFHPNSSLACNRSTYPYGNWAQVGIYALDSTNMALTRVYVEGIANRGGYFGRLQNWTWTGGGIDGNLGAGWDGDLGDPDDWANGGTITLRGSATEKFTIKRNGCLDKYPYDGTLVNDSCCSQDQSCYGDGMAISDRSGSLGGANYVFDHVDMSENTSDGLDALYKLDGKTVTVTKSNFAHNAGNQFKASATATIDASKIVSDCDYFEGKAFECESAQCGANFNDCRAAGNAVSWNVEAAGNTLDIYGTTITGKGDVLIISSGASVCNGTERLRVRNSIMQGDTQFGGGDTTDDYYASGATGNGDGTCGSLAIDWSTSGAGNIIYATKNNDTGAGISNSNPLLTDKYTDLSISSSSPARGLWNSSFGSATDFNNFTRVNASGALEYGSVPSGGGGSSSTGTKISGYISGILK